MGLYLRKQLSGNTWPSTARPRGRPRRACWRDPPTRRTGSGGRETPCFRGFLICFAEGFLQSPIDLEVHAQPGNVPCIHASLERSLSHRRFRGAGSPEPLGAALLRHLPQDERVSTPLAAGSRLPTPRQAEPAEEPGRPPGRGSLGRSQAVPDRGQSSPRGARPPAPSPRPGGKTGLLAGSCRSRSAALGPRPGGPAPGMAARPTRATGARVEATAALWVCLYCEATGAQGARLHPRGACQESRESSVVPCPSCTGGPAGSLAGPPA